MPTFTVVDKADGTGATVTVAGSNPVGVQAAYVATFGATEFVVDNLRIGDGAIDLSLVPGFYAVYVSYNTDSVNSVIKPVRVTNGTAAGPLNEPAERLRDMVSESAAFIAAAGAANATDARLRVYKSWAGVDLAELPPMPFAVVSIPKGFDWQSVSGGYGHFLLPQGRLQLELVSQATTDHEGDCEQIEQLVGNVVQDLIDAAGIDVNLPITTISLPDGVWRTRPEEDGARLQPFWTARAIITYGNGSGGE